MLETKSAGGIILNTKNKIAIVEQRNNIWSLPKGHIEHNEDEYSAAVREIYEETGLKNIKLIKRLGEFQRYKITKEKTDDKTEIKTIILFLFKTTEIKLCPLDPDNPSAEWVTIDTCIKRLTHEKDKAFLKKHQPTIETYYD